MGHTKGLTLRFLPTPAARYPCTYNLHTTDPTSFSSSCSPALKEVAEHFTSITTNSYFSELALDWRTEHTHRALTEAPTSDTTTSIPNITLLPRAAGRHS